jgi:predicted nucleic acid-binding Zn ribbon protein
MFRRLKESLLDVLGDEKLREGVERGDIIRAWEEAVGEAILQNTKVKNINRGTLTIKASTPVWRNELLFQKSEILEKINKNTKTQKIKEIRFL